LLFTQPKLQASLNSFLGQFDAEKEDSTLSIYDYLLRFLVGRRGRHTHKKSHLPKKYPFGGEPKYNKPWKMELKQKKDLESAA
jgi:hypothetical protein